MSLLSLIRIYEFALSSGLWSLWANVAVVEWRKERQKTAFRALCICRARSPISRNDITIERK